MQSSLDPLSQELADKLSKRTGCQVLQVGERPLNDLQSFVEQRKLEWKDVAYMGRIFVPLSLNNIT